jgi:threonine dehydrogenase-like Zn-dependent dehydrogenase
MWAKVLVAPSRFESILVDRPCPDQLADGQVLLDVLAGGLCGSDLPVFRGQRSTHGSTIGGAATPPGWPLHEVAGRVSASRDPDLEPGDLVVGWASGWNGLLQQVVTAGDGLARYDPALSPEHAIMLQPLACVLYAVERLPQIAGATVAILGLGPIGLLFGHVLAHRGAGRVIGIDRVDRADLGPVFGLDGVVHAASDSWAHGVADADRPTIAIEAIGHQTATLNHLVSAMAFGGTIYYFGIPDEPSYPFDMSGFLRKNLSMRAGVARDRRRLLTEAGAYLRQHPDLARDYVTHIIDIENVQRGFELACVPASGQVKIVLRTVTR